MSFPISEGAPSGPGLDPAADEAVSGSFAPRPVTSSGAPAPLTSAGRSCGASDLARGEFYLGDMAVRIYLRTPQADRVKEQLRQSLDRLVHLLAAPDQRQSLNTAIIRLLQEMDRSDERSAEMMGHGKRWLEQLVHRLEGASSLSSVDRSNILEELTRALTTGSMSPAKALGRALQTLLARLPGGPAANGFRSLLQERALMMWAAARPNLAQRVQRFGAREVATALLDGFGFSTDRPRLHRPLPTVTAEELNQAAGAIENRLDAQVVPAAHDILTRVVACVDLAYLHRPASLTPLSVDQQAHLAETMTYMQSAMGVDLMNTLRVFSPSAGSSWSLVDLSQLEQRIKDLLPELSTGPLSPDRPSGMDLHGDWPAPHTERLEDVMVKLLPPSEGDSSSSSSDTSSPELQTRRPYRQDRGSGATGTFSAGTGGASRRGPT